MHVFEIKFGCWIIMQEYRNCFLQVRHRLLFAANEQGLTVICISLWLHLFFISGFNLGVILQTSAKNTEDEHLLWGQTLLTTSLGRSSGSGIYFTEDLNSFAFQIEQLYRGLKAEIDEEVLSCHCCMCWRRSEMLHCGSSPVSENERLCNRKWVGGLERTHRKCSVNCWGWTIEWRFYMHVRVGVEDVLDAPATRGCSWIWTPN